MSRADRYADPDIVTDAMLEQRIIRGNRDAASALQSAGKIVTFEPGNELIRQGDQDSDCYFLLAGSVDLRVNGDTLPYGRASGEVVGEFSAINPTLPRTATVVAREEVVALKCESAALMKVGKKVPDVWRLLAVDLTRKVEQRNQLISVANKRPRVFMIAAESRLEIAEAVRLALSRDLDVDLWSDKDLIPPGGYQIEALHRNAQKADFAIVLAHPDDLSDAHGRMTDQQWATVRFELGYLMAELSRHRTLLLVPDGHSGGASGLFKGIQPMTYDLPIEGVPLNVTLKRAVDAIRDLIDKRKVRSRLQKEN